MIKRMIALPYELARLPVAAVGDRLTERLPEDSAARLTLDRTLGSADRLAGTVLGNRTIADRGTERLARSSRLATAAGLEDEAELRRQQAEETARDARQQAAAKRKAAQEQASSGLDEAAGAEARGKQQARAGARRTAAARKAAADKRAASSEAAAQQRRTRADAAARAKKKAAQAKAKAELDEARQNKQDAAAARADAERLSDLTEARKQERKQD